MYSLLRFSFFSLLCAISCNAFSSTKPGISYIDLNPEFAPLTEEVSNSEWRDKDVEPALDLYHSNIVELENAFIFFMDSDKYGYELHALNKTTGKVGPVFDSDEDVSYANPYKISDFRIFKVNDEQAIFSSVDISSDTTKYFITDGTRRGTKPWNYPLRFGPSFISHFSEDKVLINDGHDMYSYNEETAELEQVLSRRGADNPQWWGLPKNGTSKFQLYSAYGDLDGFLTDGTLERSIQIDLLDSTPKVQGDYELDTSEGKSFLISHHQDDKEYLASVSDKFGLINILTTDDIPLCANKKPRISLKKGAFEDDTSVYFFATFDSGIDTCIYRHNKITKSTEVLERLEVAPEILKLVAVIDGKLLLEAHIDISRKTPKFSFLTIDFDKKAVTEIPYTGRINRKDKYRLHMLDINENYMFAYLRRGCGENCTNNRLVRIDLRTQEFTDLGKRLGYTDPLNFVTGDIKTFIHNNELYLFANSLFPGLYKTNSAQNNVQLKYVPLYYRNTEPTDVDNIYPYNGGWFALSNETKTIYQILYDGTYKTYTFGLRDTLYHYTRDNDFAYFYGKSGVNPSLYEINSQSNRGRNVFNGEAAKNYNSIVNIIDRKAYIQGKYELDGVMIVKDLDRSQDTRIDVSNYRNGLGHIFKCAENLYAIDEYYSKWSSTFVRTEKLLTLSGNSISEVNVGATRDTTPYISLNFDLVEDDSILIASDSGLFHFNCKNGITKKVEGADNPVKVTPSIKYMPEQNSAYFYNSSTIFELALETLSWKKLYTGVLEGQALSTTKHGQPLFTRNGIFIDPARTGEFSRGFYRLVDGDPLPIFTKWDDKREYTFEIFDEYSDGRYLFGGYILKEKSDSATVYSRDNIHGYELFFFDSLTDEFHFLDLNPGFGKGLNSHHLKLSNNMVAIHGSNELFSNEIMLIDPKCLLEGDCTNKINNRAPIVSEVPSLFYTEGDRVMLPYRAVDEDGDKLKYSLVGNPSWLRITSTGLIHGFTPKNGAGVYGNIRVVVSDGTTESESAPFQIKVYDY